MNSRAQGRLGFVGELQINDPGSAGTIIVDKSPCVVNLVSAGAESRTLARPTRQGVIVTIQAQTAVGTITLTVTGGFNADGDTSFSLTTAGQYLTLISLYDGTNYHWCKIADYSTSSITPTEAAYLDGVTAGTGAASKALVLNSSGNLTLPGTLTTSKAGLVGGLVYSNVADSTAVTSTSTETVFDASYAIPANTVVAGSVIRITWCATVTAANGTDTGIFKLYLATVTTAGSVAGTAFVTTSTTDMTANDIISGETVIQIRTIGSSGTLVAASSFVKVEAASGTATAVRTMTNSTTINTQTIQTACVSCTFNSSNSGNSALLRVMAVEIY